MATFSNTALTTSCIDTIRVLAADMVEKATCGHPGAPMGCAPIAHTLFSEVMNYNPKNPQWFNRDRYVQSNGHSCCLLYTMLHLTGYGVSLDDLKNFRQFGSITPGHPENFATPGIEVSTGPLGQGLSNAVGMAIAEKHLAAVYNKPGFENLIDHYTYVICGDGCLQEGITSEACSLAGHLGLGKLIVLYDDNSITIDGHTDLSFTEDVNKRYEAYGWHVQTVGDVNDLQAVHQAILAAKAEPNRPSIIKVRTVIGFGSSREGTHHVHGAALGKEDLKQVKSRFGFDPEQAFVISEEVRAFYNQYVSRGADKEAAWNSQLEAYAAQHGDLAKELQRRMKGDLPEGDEWIAKLPENGGKAGASRAYSGEILNALVDSFPELVGGSADLSGSNCTNLKKYPNSFQRDNAASPYIHFGVREHAMCAISNGLFAHGGVRPFCATFLVFIGYAMGAVRLAALSRMGIIYVMTHDSIGLGEDGPTHQPVETLDALRAMPNLFTFRPADRTETKGAYVVAMKHRHTPSVLSLSRQTAPFVEGTSWEKVAQGGYVVSDLKRNADGLTYPSITLAGTGTELSIAILTAETLIKQAEVDGRPLWVRTVSMPCMELFAQQTRQYQESVFIPGSPVMSVEAATSNAWRRFAHVTFGLDNTFGMSAPDKKIYEFFGFTPSNLAVRANEVISFYSARNTANPAVPLAPSLLDTPVFPVRSSASIH